MKIEKTKGLPDGWTTTTFEDGTKFTTCWCPGFDTLLPNDEKHKTISTKHPTASANYLSTKNIKP